MEKMRRPVVFGSSLDPDDGLDRISQKIEYANLDGASILEGAVCNPYQVLRPYITTMRETPYDPIGELPIPTWLTPFPKKSDIGNLRPEVFRNFVGEGGCANHAAAIHEFIKPYIGHSAISMIGIDHSASAGPISAFSEAYGKDDLCVIVVDAHLDAVPDCARNDLLHYARENHCSNNKLDFASYSDLAGLKQSFNCGSFIKYLVLNEIIDPKNLLFLGIADTPHKSLYKAGDDRVKRFLKEYNWLESRGATIIKNSDLKADNRTVEIVASLIRNLPGSNAYLSWDLDVGSQSSLVGVRFSELRGLNESCLQALTLGIHQGFSKSKRLIGMDVMEFDFYAAGADLPLGRDKTYDIAVNLFSMFYDLLYNAYADAQ